MQGCLDSIDCCVSVRRRRISWNGDQGPTAIFQWLNGDVNHRLPRREGKSYISVQLNWISKRPCYRFHHPPNGGDIAQRRTDISDHALPRVWLTQDAEPRILLCQLLDLGVPAGDVVVAIVDRVIKPEVGAEHVIQVRVAVGLVFQCVVDLADVDQVSLEDARSASRLACRSASCTAEVASGSLVRRRGLCPSQRGTWRTG